MATSVAVISQNDPAKPVQWEQELEGAKMLLASKMLPKTITSPEAAMFIILAGRDLGLSPVQSLRSINVIQGKIEVAADMQLGLFHRSGGRSHWAKLTNEEAVLQLHAPWLMETHVETFTLEDAKRAKLGGDNWQKFPKAMLRSRAITAGMKSVGFDPTAGVYDYGEIGGPEPVVVEEPTVGGHPASSYYPETMGHPSGKGDVPVAIDEDAEVLDDEAVQSAALAELEALLPSLPRQQREWADTKLRDGSDATDVLEFIKAKAAKVTA